MQPLNIVVTMVDELQGQHACMLASYSQLVHKVDPASSIISVALPGNRDLESPKANFSRRVNATLSELIISGILGFCLRLLI